MYSINTDSRVGGGAMPEQNLPTKAVCLKPFKISVNELEEGLRKTIDWYHSFFGLP